MNGRLTCRCSICEVEQALIQELAREETAEQYRRLTRESSVLSGFPTALTLLHHLRNTATDEDQEDWSDEILGELSRTGQSYCQELRQRLVLLILIPAIHRTSRQIAHGFPSLARDDIAQQLLTSILDILQSKLLLEKQSHFAFMITRLMRRQSFRWAIREAKFTLAQESAMPVTPEVVVEDGFEAAIHLREFLRRCVDDGHLTGTEYELLVLFKIEGVSAEALATREGLPAIAFRHRMQRLVDKLRRIAQQPTLSPKRRAASCAATSSTHLPGREIRAA